MKIKKILSNTLNTVILYGEEFQVSKYWNYAAICKDGTLMIFKEKPKLINDLWFSMEDECFLATVEYDGNYRKSLLQIMENK